MKVYSPEQDYKLSKIFLTAKIYKKQLHHQQTDFQAKISKAMTQQYPQVCMPALETESGKYIFGVHTIMRYLAGNLQPSQKYLIIEQLSKMEKQLDTAIGIIYIKSKGFQELSNQSIQRARNSIIQYSKYINDDLLKFNTYLTGDHLSLADISASFSLKAVQSEFQKEWEKMKNLKRWMDHMNSISSANK